MISLDLRNAKLNEDLSLWQDKVSVAHKQLHEKTGKGNDFLGWVDWFKCFGALGNERGCIC